MKKLFCGMFTLAVFISACGKKDDTGPAVDGKDSIPVIEKGSLIKTITEGSYIETYEYDANNKLIKSIRGFESPSTYNYIYTDGLLTKITETNLPSGFNNMWVYGMVYNGSVLSKILSYDLIPSNSGNPTNEPPKVDSVTYYANNKIKALYTFSGYGEPRGLMAIDSVIWDSKGNIEKMLLYKNDNNTGFELLSTTTCTYDDKKNPFAKNLGALFMGNGGIYYELVRFSANNPLTVKTTSSGNYFSTTSYNYEYNTLGYPTKSTVAEKTNESEYTRTYTFGYYN
jgi:hypothetical protein